MEKITFSSTSGNVDFNSGIYSWEACPHAECATCSHVTSDGNLAIVTKREKVMRGLYEVLVVHLDTGEVVFEKRLVIEGSQAEAERVAEMKAAAVPDVAENPGDYGAVADLLIKLREKPMPKEVKIVNDE